jgi:DNA-binding IclR family transcriptional regulator
MAASVKMDSVKRTFHVLELLADEPEGIPFNELRRRCGDLAPTTLSRLLLGGSLSK